MGLRQVSEKHTILTFNTEHIFSLPVELQNMFSVQSCKMWHV